MHTSVLVKELLDGLQIREGDTVVDATVNGGGTSEEILKRFGKRIKLICLDADHTALEGAKKRLEGFGTSPLFIHGNFRDLRELLEKTGIQKIDRILFDLGLSSNQLEAGGRGFSFQKDEPLLMTFEADQKDEVLSAFDIVNSWQEENIEIILRAYGEERKAKAIAKAIVERRVIKPIKTSKELSEIIDQAIGRHGKIHPATKTFQALRIAVNDELETLKKGLKQAFELLTPSGRIAVISFHSLEDRIVKNFMRDRAKGDEGERVSKKPIVADEEEKKENPRSRSAKLRILQKK